MKVFEAKLQAHREKIVSLLRDEELDSEQLQPAVAAYQKELPLYIETLRESLPEGELQAALESELEFSQQVAVALEKRHQSAKSGLIKLNQGKKARKSY